MTAFSILNKAFNDFASNKAIVTSDGTELTFDQVRQRASKLASLLEKKDIDRNSLVGILMNRDSDYLIAVATCLLYGYAFIPMDREYPKERVEMILSDSKAKFIIDEEVFSKSEKEPLTRISRPEPTEGTNAYAVYTSGSTGRPKGILHDQQSLVESIKRLVKYFGLNSNDIWGVSAPFTFVALVVEVIATWCAGACVNVIPRNTVKDPEILASYINENKITTTFIPPRILKFFKPIGTSLRCVFTGSEKISNLGPNGYKLMAGYGQSETCGPCIWFNVDKEYESTPIGPAVNGNCVYLLDENGKESNEGEICISGHFMSCYINLPELTAKTVTANPFKDRDGNEELIHTGDLGRRLDDGNIIYINRKDWMIKINGQRVEPGEIESVIKKAEGVSEAAVKSFVNKYGQTYICAYYTGSDNVNPDNLRALVQNKLPAYMVPSFFVKLDALPLNANRKLDRSALKEPDTTSFLTKYEEPTSETEAVICDSFAKVLGVSRVGILDDFFKLGGDSIKAVMVAKKCSDLDVQVKHIYQGKTPKEIAKLVSREDKNEQASLSVSETMPLTDSQMGIYLDSINDKPDCRYNIPFVLCFPKENTDIGKLKEALCKVIANHKIFSVNIKQENGNPVMKKEFLSSPDIKIIETSEKEYEKTRASFVRPFNIGQDCLYRALIVKTELSVYLLFDVHHLIFDGTSINVFQKDLCCAYEKGEVCPEVVTPFIVSASEQLSSRSKERKDNLEYYENTLSDCETDSNLNPDVSAPELNISKGLCEVSLDLDSKTAEFFTRNVGITENTLFASAFAMALAKFTCQTKSLFVSVENGRSRADMDNSIGMFVRSFPVYVNVDDESRTCDYLKDVQSKFFDSMSHDFVSFSDVANSCGIDSKIKFVYQAEMLNDFELCGSRIKTQMLPVNETISNLDVMVIKHNGSYTISIGYRRSMYSQALIESFASSFNAITNGLVKSACLKDIKLADEKQSALLDSFNNTEEDYNSDETAVDMFRKTVDSYPDNDAVLYGNEKLSYRELDRLSDNIAAYIVSQNIKPDSFVAIINSRNIFMPVLIWGVLKAGCAYQPLDSTYPSDRLNFMVSDSKAELVIAERDLYPVLTEYKGKVLFTDQINSLPNASSNVKITPASRLVLLYTSGTTGLPKGVILTHKNVVSFIYNHRIYFECNSKSRYATYASFGFDAFLMDMFTTLCTGGALYIIPEEIRLDLAGLEKFYNDNRITHGFVTTQLGCMLAQSIKSKDLRYLMFGGEKIIPFTPSEDFKVFNGYGPSECTVYVTQFKVKDNSLIQPIGKANKNTKLYIADKYNRRLPVGACGELLIAGSQVSDGYLNRPEKTQEAFTENPFTAQKGYERVYRTGDITRILPDGNVEFIGRRDAQVKIRGFRIELTEVEQVIRAFEGIKNATVQAYDDPNGGKFIAAFIVSDSDVDIDKLNEFISSQKPAYMVPAVTMQLPAIPLNQNGKVDKRKLPNPEIKAEEIVKPSTELQEKILEIVCSVLGTKQIGVTTDIFKVGLTSLGTIRLNALLSDTFDIVIQTRDLKQNNTVIKLEALISKNKETTKETAGVVYPDYPITKTQEGIFIECQGDLESTAYNIPYLLNIDKDIDIRRLKIAICEAIEAHSYVNTTLFYDSNGNVRQKLAPVGCFSAGDIEVIETKALDDIVSSLVKPHKLVGGRLFRICIIIADKNYLFLDFHHIISDGTSMLIFIKDIEDSYFGKTVKSEAFSGYDVALNEQKMLNSHAFLDAEEYYQNLLTGIDTDFLPKSDMHSYAENGSGKLVISGQKGTVKKINDYCRKNKVSENAVLCTAFGHVLSLYNGTDNSLFTTVYNGRNDSRMGRTVSMLVKTLPVLFAHEKDDVFSNIEKMSNQLVDSMTNDIYSFAEISRAFSVKADVMFIFQGKGFEQTAFCGKPCSVIPLNLSDEKAPIAIQVTEKEDCFEYTVECDSKKYTDDFAYYLFKTIDNAVSQITEVSDLKDIVLTDNESIRLLDSINNREKDFDRTKTIVDMLKENAKARPEQIAVSFKDTNISYKKFDELTDNLAAHLIDNGSKKDSFIAILLGRNESMSLAAWGVVKSGAAYLPIDPTYPKERIDLMLNDSGAEILITERDKTELVSGFNGKIIFADEIEKLPNRNVKVDINEEDPFILIYSSGSTGTPKGSMLPHRSLKALYFNNTFQVGLTPDDKVGCYASFGFDAGLMDLFNTLISGATLCIIPEEIRLDIPAMDKFFIENGITHAFMTTQVARTFLLNTKCKTLRNFMFGGEKMNPFTPPENIEVFNGYGPSETNCYVTMFTLKDDRAVQPIGRQSLNTKLYVTDRKGNRLPPYACGELCISGPQTALGYLNRPEKNAQSFVKNPFCESKDYNLMYRTGDIVRMFADGNYDFVGRRDGQVKIRGFRIELGEVDSVITDYPGVNQVTSHAFDDPNGGKFIASYYVADKTISPDDIASFIKERKPSYMVPAFLMQIDSIPLTVNGKVNKAKLPAPVLKAKEKGEEPVGEVEIKLCEIFASILNSTKVYADDNFFELGGTSLSALQLVVKCVNAGFEVVYKNLFENPTPRLLAKQIKGELDTKDVFAPSGNDADKFDYSAIEYNIPENLPLIKNEGIGDVLLTGATGFLGVHVFKNLIETTDSNIICLVRHKDGISSEERLKLLTEYYFEDDISSLIGSRITVIDGEFSDSDLADKLGPYRFDTILNCAANVHHFGSEDALMRDNYQGIKALIDIAKSRNARLVQTSTISVSGESVNGHIANDFKFRENNLNIGQSLENLYVRTKYLAEQAIIDAVSTGLRGKIVRFGNLMARDADGEFQINASNSSFLNLINGLRIIGCYPVETLDTRIEFSPIDAAAKALILLAGTPDKFTCFHANNAYSIHIANILNIMNRLGYRIDYVDNAVFAKKFAEVSSNEAMASSLSGLLAYMNTGKTASGDVETRVKIENDNSFTVKALYRLGFTWPITDDEYLASLITNLKQLNFFK